MIIEPRIQFIDLIVSLSNTIDLVCPRLTNHHNRVAYIAYSISEEMGMSREKKNKLMLAGMLHDIGALSLQERMDALRFDFEENMPEHAEKSFILLSMFNPTRHISDIVRYHHRAWSAESKENNGDSGIPEDSYILNLADRIAVLPDEGTEILSQTKQICSQISDHSGTRFKPDHVDAFLNLAEKEFFWLDAVSPSLHHILFQRVKLPAMELDTDGILDLGKFFCKIIDFRSRYTATHSCGVSFSAEGLAKLAGFSERECRMMRIAGYLHDLGKLAVSREILEKPAKLTKEEFDVMRKHTFYTYRSLEAINDLKVINEWASFHHERLNGKGYPFHHQGKDLSLGARIMAVADVSTALTEDRPYRKGMEEKQALQIIKQMSDNSLLDADIVSLLERNFAHINHIRRNAQQHAYEEYDQFQHNIT